MRFLLVLSIFSLAFFAPGCGKTEKLSTSSSDAIHAKDKDTVVMVVYGMSCPLCATNVDRQLMKVEGVEGVKVDLKTGQVEVKISEQNPPSNEKLAEAVHESGFTLVGKPRLK